MQINCDGVVHNPLGGASYVFEKEIIPYILGMITAGILTYFSIRWFKDIMQKGKLKYFVYYCLVMGIITILFI